MTSLRHLRSSTADKRPDPTAMVDGQLAMNYDIASPGLFFKDDNGTLIKVGPVHVGTTAPNVSPAAGGTAGNSIGEQWLDTTSGVYVLKVWDGSAWRSESGTFVDVSGDTMTGALTMANQQAVRFSETTANGSNYIALQATAALASNKTITLPDTTGTVVTTGDTGTVTSTMIENGTILNADVNASAAIAGTKISPDFGSQNAITTGTNTAASFIPTSSGIPANGVYLPAANSVGIATNATERLRVDSSGKVGIGTNNPGEKLHILTSSNKDVRIADASHNTLTAGLSSAITFSRPSDGTGNFSALFGWNDGGIALAARNEIVFATGGDSTYSAANERLRIDSSGRVGIGTSAPAARLDVTGPANSLQARFGNVAGRGLEISTAIAIGTDDAATILNAKGATSGTLIVQTDSTERMRITNDGAALFNKTSADYTTNGVHISTDYVLSNVSSGTTCIFYRKTGTSAASIIAAYADVGGTNVNVGNALANGTWTAVSDVNLKKNVETARSYLNDIKNVRVVKYNWNTDEESAQKELGWIAQEVENIFPSMVMTSEDGHKMLKKDVFVPMLMTCMQEAIARIETLEAAVAALSN